jgi:hypothetical protein
MRGRETKERTDVVLTETVGIAVEVVREMDEVVATFVVADVSAWTPAPASESVTKTSLTRLVSCIMAGLMFQLQFI